MTDTEIVQTMAYLGWAVNAETQAVFTAQVALLAAVPTAEARLLIFLAQVLAIDVQIQTARNVVGSAYPQLQAEAQRFVYQMSNLLGLEVKNKVFRS